MHNSYNLKPGIMFNNDKGGPGVLNKIDMSKINSIVDNIIKFKPQETNLDEDLVFILNYDFFVPKTSRLLFVDEDKIVNDTDIPWKNVSFLKDKKFQIFYKINQKYWNKFILKLEKIKNRNIESLKDWTFTLKGKEKEDFIDILNLIYKLNSIKPMEKPTFQYSENDKSFSYLIELIPLSKELIFRIFKKINKESELESKNNKILLTYNVLIISSEVLDLLITYEFTWIIKSNQKKEIYDFKLDVPKEIEYLNQENQNQIPSLIKPNKSNAFIGVIDSGATFPKEFEEYFSIESHLALNQKSSFFHGSMVTSLIIANDELNKTYQDSFGNFKVKHFELLGYDSGNNKVTVSFEHLANKIENLVINNPEIKIWNLSLGGLVISRDFKITPISKIIDSISERYDVLFIIAAGNDGSKGFPDELTSPAEAFNVLSVGSNFYEHNSYNKCHYSSFGLVYGYSKPEVSTFGGPWNKDRSFLKVLTDKKKINLFNIQGTSFSTPRITRMAAYFYTKGYKPLEIKAKIINEAIIINNKNTIKASAFGCIDATEKINEFDLKFSGELFNNKPIIWPIDLKNVDFISLAGVNYVKYNSLLGDEYSITDLEIDIVQFDKNLIDPANLVYKNNNNFKKTLTKEVSNGDIHKIPKYTNEFYKRNTEGKFFTSKKIIIDLNLKNNKLKEEWTYALCVRRNNLIKGKNYISNKEPLKFAISINLQGENLSEQEFIVTNYQIIDILVDNDINVET